nr:MAG TPA: hypothetical protein [Caudoviricetes sp.]
MPPVSEFLLLYSVQQCCFSIVVEPYLLLEILAADYLFIKRLPSN